MTINKNCWSKKSSKTIFKYCQSIKKKNISIILTGGRSAKLLYKYLYKYFDKSKKKISFYLSDERLNSKKLNSSMIEKFFINKLKVLNYNFFKILDSKSLTKSLMNYSIILPPKPDLTILSVGDDGHIASLFPNNNFLDNKLKIKKIYNNSLTIKNRVTITSKVILSSKKIFVLCPTLKKKKIFIKLQKNNFKYDKKYPASILKKATWLL